MPLIDTADLEIREPKKGWRGRFFHSRKMTLAYYDVAVNSTLHEHSHSNEEVWNVIKGQLKITIDGKSKLVGPGGAAIIPPNTPHAVRVMKKARILVVDAPRRSSIGGVEI